jgi:hypothetical protein
MEPWKIRYPGVLEELAIGGAFQLGSCKLYRSCGVEKRQLSFNEQSLNIILNFSFDSSFPSWHCGVVGPPLINPTTAPSNNESIDWIALVRFAWFFSQEV